MASAAGFQQVAPKGFHFDVESGLCVKDKDGE